MRKLLLAGAACGLALAATPAQAGESGGLNLEVGGYFKGYGAFTDQDETAGTEVVDFDFIRDTEIHIGGETTIDNGLTIGTHFEFDVDQADGTEVDESYVYFSGDWGRVNFGGEDGAAYLLQVAAPSADSNVDGIRQFVSPYVATGGFGAAVTGGELDYDHDVTGKNDKLTYLSPIFSGFQLGVSYTPDSSGAAASFGVDTDTDAAGTIQETYELAARFEGDFNGVGLIAGAGYSHGVEEGSSATTDDRSAWNAGLDLDIGPFGVGAIYSEDDQGLDGTAENDIETMVLGVDYTTGAFTLGASYMNKDFDGTSVEYDRYSGGVIYQYGPGMSFRGSITHLEEDDATDADGTSVLLGTQVNF
ncbi:MAG: porin [Alphaproteobacteria bacterium]|nr:porin [Alphaproteobacteria bacterium]